MSSENVMRLWNDGMLSGQIRPKTQVVVKTASYTVTPKDFGTVLTNRGATAAVTFTLPAADAANNGEWVLFYNVANYNLIVAGADEGLVAFNDLTADSLGYETTNEKIGGAFLAVSDGTSWLILIISQETQTVTVHSA